MRPASFLRILLFSVLPCLSPGFAAAEPTGTPPAPKAPADRWNDAEGNFHRRASTGHVTNYDEAKVGSYRLPEALRMKDGGEVRDARAWFEKRRPELLELYQAEVFGRAPASAPKVRVELLGEETPTIGALTLRREYALHFGEGDKAPCVHLHLYLPAGKPGPVPVILQLTFTDVPVLGAAAEEQKGWKEAGPAQEFLERGYAYAFFRYTEIEPDGKPGPGVRALSLPESGTPAPDSWGTIAAWAWGTSRVMDLLASLPAVDAKRVALVGHSRLGKTVLWASALDTRFALVFASCSGEMGASLSRRDFGETIDDMAHWSQFAASFGKYAGNWDRLPVDAHLLLALSAPRPLFVTGGAKDLWADPRGEFLAAVAAGPVYRLLGKRDLGTEQMPALDQPLLAGDLSFHCHSGGHAITAEDWKHFLVLAERYLSKAKP